MAKFWELLGTLMDSIFNAKETDVSGDFPYDKYSRFNFPEREVCQRKIKLGN